MLLDSTRCAGAPDVHKIVSRTVHTSIRGRVMAKMSSLSNDLLSLLSDKARGGKRNILSKCTGNEAISDLVPFSANTLSLSNHS